MQIVGIGTDIIECERIGRMLERHGDYFIQRVFTPREAEYCQRHKESVERFAGRWAAKEAILKAIGTGWRHGISWLDVEVRNLPTGQPIAAIGGVARSHALQVGIIDVLVSISHCRSYATAYATAIGANDLPLRTEPAAIDELPADEDAS